MQHLPWFRRSVSALVFALIVAACSGSDGAVPSVVDDTTTEALATTTAPQPAPATTSLAPTTTAQPDSDTTVAPDTTDAPAATQPPVSLDDLTLELVEIANGFSQPIQVVGTTADEDVYVVDQSGSVWIVRSDAVVPFLDIEDRVEFAGEQGLLGFAFSPDYPERNVVYVNYVSREGTTRISSFIVEGDSALGDSEQILLEIPQPAGNHNGGMIAFGPDGYLWIGMGDGGGADDRFGVGQDAGSLLGSMLRIDVSGDGYTIPPGNPGLTDDAFAPEVYSIGMRNPWRFTIDGNDLWIADVGQGAVEEVNLTDVSEAGLNFGWPLFEGSFCYLSECDETGLTPPVYEYSHNQGCSITGGAVYRGSAIPELDGQFFFGDFCNGWIRSISADNPTIAREWFPDSTVGGLASVSADANGEVYVLSTSGQVYRIDRAG